MVGPRRHFGIPEPVLPPPRRPPRPPQIEVIESGTDIHHVWRDRPSVAPWTPRTSTSFRAGPAERPIAAASLRARLDIGRFDPIWVTSGQGIPTWYGGMTEDAALLETVFHNVPAHARAPAIGADDLRWRMLSTSRTTRDLRMIVVERDLLRGLGLTREQLVVANGTRGYQVTARWAEYLYESIRDADGITWRSRHDDREIVFVLFDLDRVRNGDIVPTGAHLSLEIGEGRDKVIRLADSLGIDYPAP